MASPLRSQHRHSRKSPLQCCSRGRAGQDPLPSWKTAEAPGPGEGGAGRGVGLLGVLASPVGVSPSSQTLMSPAYRCHSSSRGLGPLVRKPSCAGLPAAASTQATSLLSPAISLPFSGLLKALCRRVLPAGRGGSWGGGPGAGGHQFWAPAVAQGLVSPCTVSQSPRGDQDPRVSVPGEPQGSSVPRQGTASEGMSLPPESQATHIQGEGTQTLLHRGVSGSHCEKSKGTKTCGQFGGERADPPHTHTAKSLDFMHR